MHSAFPIMKCRDLAVTTDFRCAVAGILTGHMGLDDSRLERVFPGASLSQNEQGESSRQPFK